MKRCLIALCILILALSCVTAQADVYYVRTQNGKALSLHSPDDNSILLTIPYGAAVEIDESLSNDDIAYVHYKKKAGYVSWESLSKEPVTEGSSQASAPAPAAQPAAQPAAASDEIFIETVGAYIQYNQGGDTYSIISDKTLPKVIITAERRPEYWVINGIRYDFEFEIPLSFTLENVEESLVIEAVPAGRASSTLLSPEEIQEARTGEQLVVRGINAKLCHIKASGYGAGGWMNSFDFTEDFKNRATEQWEQGGQVTVRCKATIPNGKRIAYWKFDEMKIDFDTDVTQFIVRTLNVSKTYEPVFGGTAKKATPQPKTMYTISCTQCHFSGGGYSNAKSGTVPAGTTVVVTADIAGFSLNKWWINGSRTSDGGPTISRTINANTHFEWNTEIN